jgi:PAS domain S-box-containing protein
MTAALQNLWLLWQRGLSLLMQWFAWPTTEALSTPHLQHLADSLPHLVWLSDAQGRGQYFNSRWRAYTGITAPPHLQWEAAVHPDDVRHSEAALFAAAAAGTYYENEYRLRAANGSYRWFMARAAPVKDRDGKVVRFFGTCTDVHEARQRQAYQERLLAVIESSADLIGLATDEGKFAYLNSAGRRLLGVAESANRTMPTFLDLFGATDRPFIEETVLPEVMMHGRWHGDYRLRHQSTDKSFPVHLNIFATLGEDESFLGFGVISHDISEELKTQAVLEQAIASRDDFLCIASHELKTPLTALKLQLQLSARSVNVEKSLSPTPAKLQRTLSIAHRQVDRLAALVEDLLDVSRIQGGKMMYAFEMFDLGALAQEVVGRLGDVYSEAQVELHLQRDSNVCAFGDRFRIEQVMVNLLTNALKYGEKKPVHLRVYSSEKIPIFSVSDRGMGIDPLHLEKIFFRFERALSHHNISGLGLGLYISKQIVDAHSGSIAVFSQLHQGSTFTVTLPLQKAAPAAA